MDVVDDGGCAACARGDWRQETMNLVAGLNIAHIDGLGRVAD
jgi:hypothetical protein